MAAPKKDALLAAGAAVGVPAASAAPIALRHVGADDGVLELGDVTIALADVVGARASSTGVQIFEYRAPSRACCGREPPAGERTRVVHDVPLPLPDAASWAERITRAAQGVPDAAPTARRVLVVINPASGPGKGEAVFAALCAPMLRDAGCELEVVVTSRPGEAADLLRAMPAARLGALDAVLTAGGDGSLHDALQGVMQRPDARAAVSRLTFGALPTGSGNGAAVSFCAAAGLPYNVTNATLLIARRVTSRMDLASVFLAAGADGGSGGSGAHDGAPRGYGAPAPRPPPHLAAGLPPGEWGTRAFAFLAVSFGVVADLDIESEALRCLGAARFDVYGVIRGLFLRKYAARLSWLPPEAADADSSDAAPAPGSVGGGGGDAPAPPIRFLVPFSQPPPAAWRAMDGPFSLLFVTSTSHQSVGVSAVRSATHDDGVFTIAAMRDVSPARMLSALLAFDAAGSFATHPGVEVFTARAFRLEPDMAHPLAKLGHIAVDGENKPFGAVQGEIHPSLLRVYAPPGGLAALPTRGSAVDTPASAW